MFFWITGIVGNILQVLEFSGALIGGRDFGFTVTEVCLILTNLFPCNWATRAAYERTGETAKFEQFERSALFNRTTKLTTPVGVSEGCELVAL